MTPQRVPAHTRKLAMQQVSREALRRKNAPMDPTQARDLAVFAWQSLDAIPAGRGTEQDIANLEVISNVVMLLCERGYGLDALTEAIAGQMAAMNVRSRFTRTGKVGMSADDLKALRVAIDIHDQQMHLGVTVGEMQDVLAEMHRRADQGHVHHIGANE